MAKTYYEKADSGAVKREQGNLLEHQVPAEDEEVEEI